MRLAASSSSRFRHSSFTARLNGGGHALVPRVVIASSTEVVAR
jgi:hypothetical protein